MSPNSAILAWMKSERLKAVAIAAVLLFSANVVFDYILLFQGVAAANTFVNDAAIAAVGGFTVWILLAVQARQQEVARARERARLIAELNRRVRHAVSLLANAALIENRDVRLQAIDDAVQDVDRVLTETIIDGAN